MISTNVMNTKNGADVLTINFVTNYLILDEMKFPKVILFAPSENSEK